MRNIGFTKKGILISLVFLVLLLITLGFPSYIRYQFEKRFGEPNTFFYGVNLGLSLSDDYYDEEFYLDESPKLNLNLPSDLSNAKMFIYGRFVNSTDKLVIVLNDKVIFNGKAHKDHSANFYKRYYIEKYFVVELKGFKMKGSNKITISTGNANKTYQVYN